jgi:hypothetical protein
LVFLKDLDPTDKTIIDVASIGTVAATLTDMLPAVAAILTIVWTAIRIYETPTIQKLLFGDKNGENQPPV